MSLLLSMMSGLYGFVLVAVLYFVRYTLIHRGVTPVSVLFCCSLTVHRIFNTASDMVFSPSNVRVFLSSCEGFIVPQIQIIE